MGAIVSSNHAHLSENAYKIVGTVTVDQTLADSASIDYRRYSGGRFTIPNGSTITTLTWHSADEDVDASFIAAYTEANAAITQTVAADRTYPIPASLASAAYIRATGNADGTITKLVLKAL
jgi:hypothetical protein